MEITETLVRLDSLVIGSRLVVRSKKDWRFAAISKVSDGRIVLTVCSPGGHTYRLRRDVAAEIFYEGSIPILKTDEPENWRDNFSSYDCRW